MRRLLRSLYHRARGRHSVAALLSGFDTLAAQLDRVEQEARARDAHHQEMVERHMLARHHNINEAERAATVAARIRTLIEGVE